MKTVSLILFLIILMGCSSSNNVVPAQPKKAEATITINSQAFTPNVSFFGNENCDFFFINVGSSLSKEFPYRLEMQLTKKGDIVNARLSSIDGYFESALYNPRDFITIRDFEYDAETNLLSFAFDGTLFKSTIANQVGVEGRFDRLQLPSVACADTRPSRLEADVSSATGKTNRFYSALSSGIVDNVMYRWSFYSNDGYRVMLENSAGLGNLALGTYPINSESASPVRIDFREFIGQVDKINNLLFLEKDWKKYKVVGNLVVDRQDTGLFNVKYTFGTLSFTAYDENNQAVYVMKNGEFSVSSIR